jgi:hypothetical protein
MAYNGIGTTLLEYFQQNDGKIVTIGELVKAFEGRFDRTQIMSNMGNLIKKPIGNQIEKLQTGAWRYVAQRKGPDKTPMAHMVFELLRELPDALLLIGEDNELYRARKIK